MGLVDIIHYAYYQYFIPNGTAPAGQNIGRIHNNPMIDKAPWSQPRFFGESDIVSVSCDIMIFYRKPVKNYI